MGALLQPATSGVLEDVVLAVRDIDRKLGPAQASTEDGTGRDDHLALLELLRIGGAPRTFADQVEEAFAEAMVETEAGPLRAKLIELVAHELRWIGVIDARVAAGCGAREVGHG